MCIFFVWGKVHFIHSIPKLKPTEDTKYNERSFPTSKITFLERLPLYVNCDSLKVIDLEECCWNPFVTYIGISCLTLEKHERKILFLTCLTYKWNKLLFSSGVRLRVKQMKLEIVDPNSRRYPNGRPNTNNLGWLLLLRYYKSIIDLRVN